MDALRLLVRRPLPPASAALAPTGRQRSHSELHVLNTTPPEAEFLGEIQTKVLRVFLLGIHSHVSTALSWDLYFFKLTQLLIVSRVQLLYSVKEKEGTLIENHTPFPMV